jgi:hypothetical protein
MPLLLFPIIFKSFPSLAKAFLGKSTPALQIATPLKGDSAMRGKVAGQPIAASATASTLLFRTIIPHYYSA